MELKIEYLTLDKLKPYEKNARKHKEVDLSTIKASITEFGMSDPIGVWGKDNIIVEGHGRYLACEQLDRNCFMMELDPHYVDVIIARWEKFTGQKAVLLNG